MWYGYFVITNSLLCPWGKKALRFSLNLTRLMRTPVNTDTFYGPHRVWLYLGPFCGHPEGNSKAESGIWVKSSRDYSFENCQVGRLCFQCSCFTKWLKLKTRGWDFELSVASVIWKSGNYLRDNLLCRWWRFCLVLGERFPMARKNKLELTMERFWDALRVNSNHVTKRSYVSFITWVIIFRAVFDLF